MTDHDDHDAEAAPTQQANPPSTELSPAEHGEPPEASSLDETAEADVVPRSKLYVRVMLATLLVAIVGMFMISPVVTLFEAGSSKRAELKAKPTTSVAVTAPRSGVAVAPGTAPGFSVHDQNFLTLMSHEGWGCSDNSGEEQCEKQLVSFAHQICSYSGQPIDLIYQDLGLPAFLAPREERRAIANAEQAYPNCTFTEGP